MGQHTTFDQETLRDLWRLAKETEVATKWQSHHLEHIYLCTSKGELQIREEKGLIKSILRFFNKKWYVIEAGSPTAENLRKIHDKTADLSEQTLVKAISASSLVREEVSINEVLDKIKSACRIVNLILQHIMEHKVEHAVESRQEEIKLFFNNLFLPSFGVSDARRGETVRAYEELRRAHTMASNQSLGIVEKVQGYLDAAVAQLNVAMSGKEEAQHILNQANNARSQESLDVCAARAKECAGSADEALKLVTEIAKQADILVKAKASSENQPVLNFGEIEELKKIREIINVVGQVAEYAESAKNAASRVVNLSRPLG